MPPIAPGPPLARVTLLVCPRCQTPVPTGATRCQSCAERAGAAALPNTTPDLEAAVAPASRKVLAVGCLTTTAALILCTVLASVLGSKVREMQQRATRREQQKGIDDDRRRFESEQSRGGRPPVRIVEPTGGLAILGRPLRDLEGHEVSPAATLEHGGVAIIYPMGCADCVAKLAGAEKCLRVARENKLGAQLIVVGGTAEGVAKDKLPASLREIAVLDTDRNVGETLHVDHLTAIVVDADGSSVVYKGTPEEAAGMIPSVAQGE